MTTLMPPNLVNLGGKVHGGARLKLLDEVAYSCAARFSGHYVVTLLIDDARFRAPVHVGELVTFLARVNWVGRTSMEVGVRVVAENHRTRVERHVVVRRDGGDERGQRADRDPALRAGGRGRPRPTS